MAAIRKRYKETHQDRVAESKKRYEATHRTQLAAAKRRRYRENKEIRAYHRAYNQRYRLEHRERLLAQQREWYQRQKEQRQALRTQTLRVVLTDYVKDICQSLETKGDSMGSSSSTSGETLCQTPQPEGDSGTLTDLDSGDITPLGPPVWDTDANQWLDELMEVLENPLKDNALEDNLDLKDLLEDMSPDDWAQVVEDMCDSFDLDAFVS